MNVNRNCYIHHTELRKIEVDNEGQYYKILKVC